MERAILSRTVDKPSLIPASYSGSDDGPGFLTGMLLGIGVVSVGLLVLREKNIKWAPSGRD